ncbi:MAG: HAD-IB family hydrolase [Actinobacteria bacterium]|nr:HAD-IB family hydrolase [Actinomycetota bacterium]MBI3686772.1 HAD-IB family hydrolase [Actinomycetota bacterium]
MGEPVDPSGAGGGNPGTGPRAAFFDVDGTLTAEPTIFRFLEYLLAAQGHPPSAYERERRRLQTMTTAGLPRSRALHMYFRNYAGLAADLVAEVGEAWFASELRGADLFNPTGLGAFRRHAAAGDLLVLVSGSFSACLDPLSRHLAADETICTQPEIRAGTYTGRITVSMVGQSKAAAVARLATERGISVAQSWGYGDHISDLPLLETVGHPVIVGDDREMVALAGRRGWTRLPPLPPTLGGLPTSP